MPTVNYTILARRGPFDSIQNVNGSTQQATTRYWEFAIACSFHASGHSITLADPYTAASVKEAAQDSCRQAYQSAPEIGQSWSQVF